MILTQHSSGRDCDELVELTETRHRMLAHENGWTFVLDRRPFSGKACLEKLLVVREQLDQAQPGELVGSIDTDNLVERGDLCTELMKHGGYLPGWQVAMTRWSRGYHAGVLFVKSTPEAIAFVDRCIERAQLVTHGRFPAFLTSELKGLVTLELPALFDQVDVHQAKKGTIIHGWHCRPQAVKRDGINAIRGQLDGFWIV